jgi:hypothetical protein
MVPVPLTEKPQFWIAFALAESSIPIMIPNKRWMGITMFALAILFYASAAGWLPDTWTPKPWQQRELIITVLIGLGVVLFGVATLIWFVRRSQQSGESARLMSDHITVVSSPAAHSAKQDYFEITTNNQQARLIETKGQVIRLRFVIPKELEVVELPAYIPIGKGRIIIKAFTTVGIRIEEENTQNDRVKAEIYYK